MPVRNDSHRIENQIAIIRRTGEEVIITDAAGHEVAARDRVRDTGVLSLLLAVHL